MARRNCELVVPYRKPPPVWLGLDSPFPAGALPQPLRPGERGRSLPAAPTSSLRDESGRTQGALPKPARFSRFGAFGVRRFRGGATATFGLAIPWNPAGSRPRQGPTGRSPGRRRRPGLAASPHFSPSARRVRQERWGWRPRGANGFPIAARSCWDSPGDPAPVVPVGSWRTLREINRDGAAYPTLLRRVGLCPVGPLGLVRRPWHGIAMRRVLGCRVPHPPSSGGAMSCRPVGPRPAALARDRHAGGLETTPSSQRRYRPFGRRAPDG
jgi:hypothetical protein